MSDEKKVMPKGTYWDGQRYIEPGHKDWDMEAALNAGRHIPITMNTPGAERYGVQPLSRHEQGRLMTHPTKIEPTEERCGICKNCVDLGRVRRRCLAACNPPFSHADDSVVELWNTELARLPCLGKEDENAE